MLLNCSQHTLVKKRHETLLKAFGCLEQYKQCRLKFTKYCIGKGSKIPITKISKFATQPNPTKICPLSIKTINSNIKNNAGNVKVWTPKGEINVGMKCGMMMGDYSRTAINTSVNSGTVIGVSCNIFGNGLTPKYIPSFSWGSEGVKRYDFKKAIQDIENWMQLKNKSLSQNGKSILKYIFDNY